MRATKLVKIWIVGSPNGKSSAVKFIFCSCDGLTKAMIKKFLVKEFGPHHDLKVSEHDADTSLTKKMPLASVR